MAAYFSYLPNIYVGTGTKSDTKQEYQVVKNIFSSVKAREDLAKFTEFFEQYEIQDGQLPFQIAQDFYGDDDLDWVILLTNNITDQAEEWPKSRRELEFYCNAKYNNLDAVHHYETVEKTWKDIIILEGGTIVDSTFTFKNPDGIVFTGSNIREPISNWEHEYYEIEKKRQIYIAQPQALESFIEEFEELIGYAPSDELDENGVKKTELSVAERFLGSSSGGGIGRQYSSTYTGTGRTVSTLVAEAVAEAMGAGVTTETTIQSDASTGQQAAEGSY